MSVFVNRTLNLKKIKLIGFDMDYTLVPYDTRAFEALTYRLALDRLVKSKKYPKVIKDLEFEFERAIVGLVIDRRNGFILQLNRYNKVKNSYFGTEQVDFKEQNRIYQNLAIDIREADFKSLDTSFAIANGVLFGQLVELKKQGIELPPYYRLDEDIVSVINELHQDDSLKSVIRKDFASYVIQEPEIALMLERFKEYGKKLMIITNSDYAYTRALLNYSLNPFFKNHSSWQDVFDIVITLADKPKFFELNNRFLSIDRKTGLMSNHDGPVLEGLFQGGSSRKFQDDTGFSGSEILYLGDHIYGDVVSIKKQCDWRTALVLGDLEGEMEGIRKGKDVQAEIDGLMAKKTGLEKEINRISTIRFEGGKYNKAKLDKLYREMDGLNSLISDCIGQYNTFFNPYWGEILRAGSEESRFAEQVEKYACIYMTRVSDLYRYSPRTYFRPDRRILPHERAALEE
ncbi:MAG: HAD-IG family 5'-nucleotidase [Spirochaetales bacterium]|nr:HAD-IG family 5'-nucleotidase [Spirochaetales bacterium]